MAPMSGKRKRNVAGSSGPKSKRGRKKAVKSNDSDSEQEGAWAVEEVMGKRINNGRTEYLLRWKNWDPNDLTWEPIDNLNCPELISKYETKTKAPNGFDKGYTARGVRGVVQLENGSGDELYYLVEWEDHDGVEKIPAKIVREHIPQEVIKFLSTKIKWTHQRTPADEVIPKEEKVKSSTAFDRGRAEVEDDDPNGYASDE